MCLGPALQISSCKNSLFGSNLVWYCYQISKLVGYGSNKQFRIGYGYKISNLVGYGMGGLLVTNILVTWQFGNQQFGTNNLVTNNLVNWQFGNLTIW